MCADAQRDGRPAEYKWRPLMNAAKFGSRALLKCRAVTLHANGWFGSLMDTIQYDTMDYINVRQKADE